MKIGSQYLVLSLRLTCTLKSKTVTFKRHAYDVDEKFSKGYYALDQVRRSGVFFFHHRSRGSGRLVEKIKSNFDFDNCMFLSRRLVVGFNF